MALSISLTLGGPGDERIYPQKKTLAGIQVYRTAFKQQVATVRGVLQDHYANKVLVMINNVPSWHAVTGEGNLDRVSIHDVERIEVLRGPASVTYGSQAYVGAINLIFSAAKQCVRRRRAAAPAIRTDFALSRLPRAKRGLQFARQFLHRSDADHRSRWQTTLRSGFPESGRANSGALPLPAMLWRKLPRSLSSKQR